MIVKQETKGEASLLTFDESSQVDGNTINAAEDRMQLIAGTGCASTKETVADTESRGNLE